jgi:hypothetical protein
VNVKRNDSDVETRPIVDVTDNNAASVAVVGYSVVVNVVNLKKLVETWQVLGTLKS